MIKSDALRELVAQSGVKNRDIIAFGHIPFDEDQLVKFIQLVIECQRKLDKEQAEDRCQREKISRIIVDNFL